MKELASVLEKIYNRLGNRYLTENFDTEPFEFKVNFRRGKHDDLQDWIVEVYSVPDMPKQFMYKNDEKNGIHISVLSGLFTDYIKYFDSSFGIFGKSVGVKFMNGGK